MFHRFRSTPFVATAGLLALVTYRVAAHTPAADQQPPARQGTAAPAPQRESLKGAPDRRPDEGKGPFKTLAIRGVMVIDGTGGPPSGPMDVIVQGNRAEKAR